MGLLTTAATLFAGVWAEILTASFFGGGESTLLAPSTFLRSEIVATGAAG